MAHGRPGPKHCECPLSGVKRTSLSHPKMSDYDPKQTSGLVLADPINCLSYSIARCREVIAVAVSQIDGDPIVSDRLVDPPLEITVAHIQKIVALQCAGRRYPMAHENAEDLMANVLVGRSVRHRSPSLDRYSTSYKPMRAAVTATPALSRELSSFVFNRPAQSRHGIAEGAHVRQEQQKHLISRLARPAFAHALLRRTH